jgi:hypothetical protein
LLHVVGEGEEVFWFSSKGMSFEAEWKILMKAAVVLEIGLLSVAVAVAAVYAMGISGHQQTIRETSATCVFGWRNLNLDSSVVAGVGEAASRWNRLLP